MLPETCKNPDCACHAAPAAAPEVTLRAGTRVRTTDTFGDVRGMLVATEYLAARRPAADGVISGVAPGHGGDVYWVRHDDGDVAAYSYTEFCPVAAAPPPPVLSDAAARLRDLLLAAADPLRDIGMSIKISVSLREPAPRDLLEAVQGREHVQFMPNGCRLFSRTEALEGHLVQGVRLEILWSEAQPQAGGGR